MGDFDGRNGPDVVTLRCTDYTCQLLLHRNLGTATGIVFDDSTSPTPTAAFPLGDTVVTLVVNDGHEDSDTATAVVRVQDTTPPALSSVAATPDVLWPPSHHMVSVGMAVTSTDACDPNPLVVLESAVSSEPDDAPGGGDGHTSADIQDG